jgi:ATP-binding cassette subfamily F protein 1
MSSLSKKSIKTKKDIKAKAKKEASKDEDSENSKDEIKEYNQKKESLVDGFIFSCEEETTQNVIRTSKTRDVRSRSFSITVFGKNLFLNSELNLSYGFKYGLIGKNGVGKSTLLKHIYTRKFPVSNSLNIIYVEQEIEPSDLNPVEAVLLGNEKRFKLLQRIKKLEKEMETDDNYNYDDYEELQEELRLDGGDKDEHLIKRILYGLGFSLLDQEKSVKLFSGGWRMRIALAKALYMEPELLILDEPTNHLDLNAVMWLTSYLKIYKKTLLVVSHDRNFLNEITSHILNIEDQKVIVYRGDYDSFKQMYAQKLLIKEKYWDEYSKELKRCHNKEEKEKVGAKHGNPIRPEKEYKVSIPFQDSFLLDPPLLEAKNVSFSFNDTPLFKDLNFNITIGCKIALVGPNGVGKTTLLRLLMEQENPLTGEIIKNPGLRIGYYSQHFANSLPDNMKVIDYLIKRYNDAKEPNTIDDVNTQQYVRRFLGLIGLDNKHHNKLISELSGGQKARVAFVSLFVIRPHVILLDEPTNHLDIETIDGLIEGIKSFTGSVVLITHNLDLIRKTECSLFIIRSDKNKVEKYNGNIDDYESEMINLMDQTLLK